MSTALAIELVEQLEDNLDDLDDTLQPLLARTMSDFTKKLPLLDRAKLYITVVYAIESLLFSYLKVNGVNAKEHQVFRELTRVKQYFEKIKEAENNPVQARPREMSLDKQAALRMIKHSLTGNNKIDLEKAEADARQKLLAKRKLKLLETSMREKAAQNDYTRTDIQVSLADEQEVAELVASASEAITSGHTEIDEKNSPTSASAESSTSDQRTSKKRKQENIETNKASGKARKPGKSLRRKNKKEKRREREAAAANSAVTAGHEIGASG